MMKAAWRPELVDHADLNSKEIEVVEEEEFASIFMADEEWKEWDEEEM